MDDDSDSVFDEVGDDATVVAAGVVETRVQRKHSTEDGVFVGGGDQRLVSLLVVFLGGRVGEKRKAEEEEEEEMRRERKRDRRWTEVQEGEMEMGRGWRWKVEVGSEGGGGGGGRV